MRTVGAVRYRGRAGPARAIGAALLVLWASVTAAAAAEAGGRLLVVERGTVLTALAADGEAVWFAVVPPPPIQANPETPPVFIPVRADGRSATGTAVLGLWTPGGAAWLTPLPGDLAQGGRNAYAISDIVPQNGGAWATGPVNRPERPIGRYYLARVDRRGTARIAEADDGTAALALAAAKDWPYVARGAERSGQASAARIAWPGRWARDFVLAGPGASFQWTPGHGLAPAPDGVWGVAHFRGTVRVDGVSARSPALKDLPFHAGPDGGLPPAALEGLRQMLRAQPMPGLTAALVVRLGAQGKLLSLTTLAPDALHVGVSTGAQGMDPAWIEVMPLLATDPSGRAFVFGRYRHAIRAGQTRLVADETSETDGHCFLASWEAAGELRWLREVPRCTGAPIGLAAEAGRVVAVTAHRALILDPETGAVRRRLALPRPERTRGPPDFRWTKADASGDRLVLGGVFRGDAELLGRRVALRHTGVVLAVVPLDSASR